MMMGLGTTTAPATTATPTFGSGLSLWASPSAAIAAIGTIVTSPTTAFSSPLMSFSAGVLIVPVALIVVLFSMGKGKR